MAKTIKTKTKLKNIPIILIFVINVMLNIEEYLYFALYR